MPKKVVQLTWDTVITTEEFILDLIKACTTKKMCFLTVTHACTYPIASLQLISRKTCANACSFVNETVYIKSFLFLCEVEDAASLNITCTAFGTIKGAVNVVSAFKTPIQSIFFLAFITYPQTKSGNLKIKMQTSAIKCIAYMYVYAKIYFF